MAYLLFQIYVFFYGVRTLTGNGLGADGIRYASWVMNNYLLSDYFHTLSPYYVQRILPSIVVHYLMVFAHLNLQSNTNVIKSFLFLDNIMVLLTIWGLFKIARFLKWSPEATFVAFITLVVNFFILKQMNHYSTLTDYVAFTIGFFQIYFYIRNKDLYLYLISLIGVFVWPTLLATGLLMFIFKPISFQKKEPNPSLTFYQKNKLWKPFVLSFLFACIFTTLFHLEQGKLYLYMGTYICSQFNEACSSQLNHLNILFMPAVFIILIYAFYVVWPFLKVFCKNVLKTGIINKKFLINTAIAVLTYFAMSFIVHHLSNPSVANAATFGTFLMRPFYPVLYPGICVIGYPQFLGLGIFLFIFLYPKINFNLISSVGASTTLLMLIFFVIEPESRQSVSFFPMVAVLLGAYLNQHKLSLRFCFCYLGLSYFFSRAWLPHYYPYESWSYPHIGFILLPIGAILLLILLKREKLL